MAPTPSSNATRTMRPSFTRRSESQTFSNTRSISVSTSPSRSSTGSGTRSPFATGTNGTVLIPVSPVSTTSPSSSSSGTISPTATSSSNVTRITPAAAAASTTDSVDLGVGLFFGLLALLGVGVALVWVFHKLVKAQRSVSKPAKGSVVNYEDLAKKQYLQRGGKPPKTIADVLFPNKASGPTGPLSGQETVIAGTAPTGGAPPTTASPSSSSSPGLFASVRNLVFPAPTTPISSRHVEVEVGPGAQQQPQLLPPLPPSSSVVTSNPLSKAV